LKWWCFQIVPPHNTLSHTQHKLQVMLLRRHVVVVSRSLQLFPASRYIRARCFSVTHHHIQKKMSQIKVYAQDKAPEGVTPRLVLVFDEIDTLTNLSVEQVSPLFRFSDMSSYELLKSLSAKLSPGADSASSIETCLFRGNSANAEERVLSRVSVIVLPLACSRHNSPARTHALAAAVKGVKSTENTTIVVFPKDNSRAFAQAIAAGRAFSSYSLKGSDVSATAPSSTQTIDIVVQFPAADDASNSAVAQSAEKTIENIRLAQKLVDMPPNVLHTDAYVSICEDLSKQIGCQFEVIKGIDLEKRGFGGLWGVGKASEHLPALVVLSHYPEGTSASTESVCMVGKGIVYDTGGLSIKTPTTNMAGMKCDMGGSAAVLGAFVTSVTVGGLKQPLHALLCLAENSVGPLATRPDDIHVMLSGKTVEVNNTDAEGRLVLSDGVFYAYQQFNPKAIVDIATLTGAQLIATGKNHAAIYCNDEELEDIAIKAGKHTGDLTFPVPYCPEFYRNEFRSQVADMKNSVADRGNAQTSCAGQFIGNHLEEYLNKGGKWLHVDMAGPAMVGERATGYGVALLYEITKRLQV
jgi:probable aminopeptidase NPEPL1